METYHVTPTLDLDLEVPFTGGLFFSSTPETRIATVIDYHTKKGLDGPKEVKMLSREVISSAQAFVHLGLSSLQAAGLPYLLGFIKEHAEHIWTTPILAFDKIDGEPIATAVHVIRGDGLTLYTPRESFFRRGQYYSGNVFILAH